jgi:hypothetical protein
MTRKLIAVTTMTLLLSAAPAVANHRPNSACSESGDVCISAKADGGVRKLKISLGAKYFNRYKLCVTTPDEERTCHRYRIGKSGDVYGDSVRWDTHFPDGGSGAYDVVWRQGGNKLGGETLGFHVE